MEYIENGDDNYTSILHKDLIRYYVQCYFKLKGTQLVDVLPPAPDPPVKTCSLIPTIEARLRTIPTLFAVRGPRPLTGCDMLRKHTLNTQQWLSI